MNKRRIAHHAKTAKGWRKREKNRKRLGEPNTKFKKREVKKALSSIVEAAREMAEILPLILRQTIEATRKFMEETNIQTYGDARETLEFFKKKKTCFYCEHFYHADPDTDKCRLDGHEVTVFTPMCEKGEK